MRHLFLLNVSKYSHVLLLTRDIKSGIILFAEKIYCNEGNKMSLIYNSVEELVGRTPLVRLGNTEKDNGLCAKIIAKLEYFNPAGSAKDRVAKKIIDDAEREGRLKAGAVSSRKSEIPK